MKIGDVEKKTGLNAKTIRYYESRGLIQVSRTGNQYRAYDEETVDQLLDIKQMRELGISLADIRLWRDGVVSRDELIQKRLQTLDDDDKRSRHIRAFCENFLQSGTLPVSEAISLDFQESEMGEEADSGQPLLLGIDIGTTSIGAQVIAADTGKSIQTYSFDHHAGLLLPEYPDAYAADASRLLERAVALTDSLIRTYPSIVSIGITGQMHGIVCVGHEGEILSPLYTWQNAFGLRQVSHADPRTYCQKIFDCCGERIPTGYGLVTCYALEQLGMFPTGTTRIATIMDLLSSRLAGSPIRIHPTNAASLGGFDLTTNRFKPGIMEKLGLDPTLLPPVSSDYEVVGYYREGDRQIPVSAAIGDNQAGVFGSLADNNMVLMNVGTSSQVSIISTNPSHPGGEVRPFLDGTYIVSGAALCGGRAYAMLSRLVRSITSAFGLEPSSKAIYEYLNQAAELDYGDPLEISTTFCGTRTDPELRGSIRNIGPDNLTPSALSSGILHGIIQELYDMYLLLREQDDNPIPVVSGNAMRRNPVLRNICGKFFNTKPGMTLHTEEAAFGAALYGAVSAGILTRQESRSRIQYL